MTDFKLGGVLFTVGDRVSTVGFGNGVILESPFSMPNHHLIQFDSGKKFWILRRILQPPSTYPCAKGIVEPAKKRRRKSA